MEGVKGLYGAPSLALGLVLKQEWARSLAAQARVGQHGLVSRQSVGECPVQGGAVVEPHILGGGHEGLWEAALDPFGVGVPGRRARIGPPVRAAVVVEALREMAEALRPVVGEDAPGGGGESAHSESRAWWVWPRGPLAWVNVCCQR